MIGKKIFICTGCFVIFLSLVLYILFTPYKLIRKLPKLSVSDINKVTFKSGGNIIENRNLNLDMLVKNFNNLKEIKNKDGTTPDSSIEISLKDGSNITLWDLDNSNRITIGFKKSDGSYYQTNAHSKELADLLN